MKRLQIILLCFLLSAGCAGLQVERRVDGNVFYSSRSPKLTMSVDNSLKYIGEHKSEEIIEGPDFADTINISAYPFVKVKENNFIQQMLIVMLMKFEDPAAYIRYLSGEKEVKVGGEKYKAFAGVGTITQWFDALKINFLSQSGYSFSTNYGGMRLSRILDRGAWMSIVYLEEASPYSNLTEYKESVLKRGLLAFEINGKKKETDPNLSPTQQVSFKKYLDAERYPHFKAFAAEVDGDNSGWGWGYNKPENAIETAMQYCSGKGANCQLYAVGKRVVINFSQEQLSNYLREYYENTLQFGDLRSIRQHALNGDQIKTLISGREGEGVSFLHNIKFAMKFMASGRLEVRIIESKTAIIVVNGGLKVTGTAANMIKC